MTLRKRHNSGASIREIVIVLVAIAVMACIAIPRYREAQTLSRNSRAVRNLRVFATALEAYRADNPGYPPSLFRVFTLLSTPVAYLDNPLMPDEFPPLHFSSIPDPDTGVYTINTYQNPDQPLIMAHRYREPGLVTPFPADGMAYVIASAGPDLVASNPGVLFGSNASVRAIANNMYDPTNGTTSQGDIYRVGGVIPAQPQIRGYLFMRVIGSRGGYMTPDPTPRDSGFVAGSLLSPDEEANFGRIYYDLNADNLFDGADVQAANEP